MCGGALACGYSSCSLVSWMTLPVRWLPQEVSYCIPEPSFQQQRGGQRDQIPQTKDYLRCRYHTSNRTIPLSVIITRNKSNCMLLPCLSPLLFFGLPWLALYNPHFRQLAFKLAGALLVKISPLGSLVPISICASSLWAFWSVSCLWVVLWPGRGIHQCASSLHAFPCSVQLLSLPLVQPRL